MNNLLFNVFFSFTDIFIEMRKTILNSMFQIKIPKSQQEQVFIFMFNTLLDTQQNVCFLEQLTESALHCEGQTHMLAKFLPLFLNRTFHLQPVNQETYSNRGNNTITRVHLGYMSKLIQWLAMFTAALVAFWEMKYLIDLEISVSFWTCEIEAPYVVNRSLRPQPDCCSQPSRCSPCCKAS